MTIVTLDSMPAGPDFVISPAPLTMNRFLTGCLLAVLGVQAPSVADLPFRVVDIQRDWGVVYAVRVADVNADGRPDIIAINPSQLAWFENPSWQRHVIVDG